MKNFIKTIYIIISLLLVFSLVGALISCDNSYFRAKKTDPDKIKDETGKLSDKMKREIQVAYYKSNEERVRYPRRVSGVCYGVFDDAYCLTISLPDEMYVDTITKVEVGEYRFIFGSSNVMIVCCDDEIYSLNKAYENGILDDAELAELYILYNKVQWGEPDNEDVISPWDNESLPVPIEIKREIQIAELIDKHGEGYAEKGFATEQVAVICYGIFDDVYCVFTWEEDAGIIIDTTEIKVGEYTFIFENPKRVMRAYKDGEFYSLNEAYENGILDDAEIEELYTYYTETRWG